MSEAMDLYIDILNNKKDRIDLQLKINAEVEVTEFQQALNNPIELLQRNCRTLDKEEFHNLGFNMLEALLKVYESLMSYFTFYPIVEQIANQAIS